MSRIKWMQVCLVGMTIVGCAAQAPFRPVTDTVTILQNAAALLRAETLEAEARIIETAAGRIHESRRRGEGSVFLGFAPDQRLKEYAVRLREMDRKEAASKLEEYARAYWEDNVRGFLLQQQR